MITSLAINKVKQQSSCQNEFTEGGFTLIELLAVIMIIGALSAIAVPAFTNQANKAKQSEAKQYIGSMNRAQQTKYAEQGYFSTTTEDLGIGIKTQTSNYSYRIATDTNLITHTGVSLVSNLKGFAGNVGLITPNSESNSATIAILCEMKQPGSNVPTSGILIDQGISCGVDQNEVKK